MKYAKGECEEATCRVCGSAYWIVYNGPNQNHTKRVHTQAPPLPKPPQAPFEQDPER